MAMFSRALSTCVINTIKQDPLFCSKDRLLKDTRNGMVFPAIRNQEVHFYYEGGKLFGFKKRFETHAKYCTVLDFAPGVSYMGEKELRQSSVVADFNDARAYARIKELCAKYTEAERRGVSNLCRTSSYAKRPGSRVVVLDVEVGFSRAAPSGQTDRIDILLFDKESLTLRFVEAKLFDNSALWSSSGTPKVVDQISRYEKRIRSNGSQIVQAYRDYVKVCRELFGIKAKDLPLPKSVDKNVTLLVYGYRRPMLDVIKKSLMPSIKKSNIKIKHRGNTRTAQFTAEWLWA